jgi:hypothetical protein
VNSKYKCVVTVGNTYLINDLSIAPSVKNRKWLSGQAT